jgi:membrane protease YdiL (CAAX protease family)
LRWFDLLVVLTIAAWGLVLVNVTLYVLGSSNRAFVLSHLETINLLASMAAYLVIGAGLVVALRRLRSPVDYLGLRWPTWRQLLWLLPLFAVLYVGLAVVLTLSSILFNGGHPMPSNTRLVFPQPTHGIGLIVLALLVTAVAAPICEETVFRGMLLPLLRERLPFWLAVALSSVAFGLAHVNPALNLASIPAFIYMGVVLALVYTRTGRLTNAILLHGLNNAFVVTLFAFNVGTR